MEKIKMKNKNGNMVERTFLVQLEGEALELCKDTSKYFIYADRSTGRIFASPMGNRLTPEEKAARTAKKLEKINARLKKLNDKKAELEG